MKNYLPIKTLTIKLILVLSFLSFYTSYNAQINVLWESRFTSIGSNADSGKEIDVDANGNVYVTGTSYTNATNGFDIVTIKYDANGVQQWIATFNGSGNGLDEGRDIAVDTSGNVYVTGYTASSGPNYDYVTIMYNNAGTQQWVTTYNGSGNDFDEAYNLAIDNSGNCYVTGGSDAGSQGTNFVTIKYNNAGVQQWVASYNGPGNSADAAKKIVLDASNNVYVTGQSFGSGTDLDIATVKYNNSGTQQWVSRFNGALNFFDVPEALYVDALNNIYVAGATYGGLATLNDYVTIKIDNAGNQQWAKIFDGPLNDEDVAFDVLSDANGNVYVAGRSMGAAGTAENMVTIKYDAAGNLIWQDTYNGPSSGYDDAQQMRLGGSGALYVTGYSAGNGTNNDYLTLKYDTANGNINWKARFDGPASNSDQAFAMEIDATESIYVTGSSTDPASFKDYSTIKWCQLDANAGADVEICYGGSTPIGTSPVSGYLYSWTPSTGLSSATVSSPTASPTTTTNYILSTTNGLGCVDLDTVTVTVNPLPDTTITTSGPITFCDGDSVILTASSANIYYWTPTGESSQSITVDSSATYTVALTDSNNCSNSGQIVVTVNPLPNVNVGSDASLCNGSSMTLNATGAVNYTWNTQVNLSDSTIANPVINPTTPTTFWVIGEDANNCSNTDTIFIAISVSPTSIIDPPAPNDTLDIGMPNGGDIQFFGSSSTNAISYSWKFGDGGSDVVPNPIYTYTTTGLFNTELITTNGSCNDTAYIAIFVMNSIGINEQSLNNLVSVFPNPAKEQITLSFKDNKQVTDLEIIDDAGKIVLDKKIEPQSNDISINVSSIPSGFYFIKLTIDNKVVFKPISIIH